jgi:1-acyl-sn-glycerol-3-phosphate acyltransferase
MRAALRALHDGRVLGVFPEGRIEVRRELLPFQRGVAQMALKTGAPVYPAFLDGTQHGIVEMAPAFIHRQRATLRFGPRVALDRSDGAEATATKMRDAIAALSHGGRWEKEWSESAKATAAASAAATAAVRKL